MRDRLGHQVDGIGVVEQNRVGAHGLHIGHDALHDIDRAQGHEEAARPLRFLANDAVLQRNALVVHARLEAAGPEAGEHRIAIAQALAPVRRGAHGDVEAARLDHLVGQNFDQCQSFFSARQINQHHL